MANQDKVKLSPRKEAFCEHYVRVLNRAKAARLAGYVPATAKQEGYRLMQEPEVRSRIAELQEEWRERIGVSTEKVLRELSYLAFSDMRDFVEWTDQGANLKPSSALKSREARAIVEIKNDCVGEDGNGVVKLKLHSKERALELLGKHLGIFNEKSEIDHSGKITVEITDRRADAPKN